MRYTAAKSRPTYTFDANLEFKDAGLIAADDNAQVDGADKIVDVGAGYFSGHMVIDVTAIEIADNDERYEIMVQGSSSSSFASDIEQLATIVLGANEILVGADQDSDTGRYILPFTNRGSDGELYRYLRLSINVSGTIATGINFSAFASPTQS